MLSCWKLTIYHDVCFFKPLRVFTFFFLNNYSAFSHIQLPVKHNHFHCSVLKKGKSTAWCCHRVYLANPNLKRFKAFFLAFLICFLLFMHCLFIPICYVTHWDINSWIKTDMETWFTNQLTLKHILHKQALIQISPFTFSFNKDLFCFSP